jgi:nucleotidyltransferase substrate binding protein (TIGR01987 family)
LKSAYQIGIIKDENIWLEALATRNNMAHAYNQVIAIEIVRNTKAKYYNMFCKLKEEIENNWI